MVKKSGGIKKQNGCRPKPVCCYTKPAGGRTAVISFEGSFRVALQIWGLKIFPAMLFE